MYQTTEPKNRKRKLLGTKEKQTTGQPSRRRRTDGERWALVRRLQAFGRVVAVWRRQAEACWLGRQTACTCLRSESIASWIDSFKVDKAFWSGEALSKRVEGASIVGGRRRNVAKRKGFGGRKPALERMSKSFSMASRRSGFKPNSCGLTSSKFSRRTILQAPPCTIKLSVLKRRPRFVESVAAERAGEAGREEERREQLHWGLLDPWVTFNVDQVPLPFAADEDINWPCRLEARVGETDWLGPRQRQATLQLCINSCQGRAAQTLPYLSWRAEAQQDAARRAEEVWMFWSL